ncbi:MAG: terminase TerL endonuclease subunit [Clostridia bacterium]
MYNKCLADDAVVFIKMLTHTKGKFAGTPFNVINFQEKIIRDLIGEENEDGFRKYREAFIFMPRKNGKTELIAALVCYFLFIDMEKGAEIYSCANDRDQASLVFKAVVTMIRNNPALEMRCKIIESRKMIKTLDGQKEYRAISAEASTKHGFNASVVIYDEIHESKKRDLYDVLMTSMGTREQPLFVSITTAGDDMSTVCGELYEHSKRVLKDNSIDPSFYPVIYEAPENCDIYNEKNWFIANPGLGIFRSLEEMRKQANRAKEIRSNEKAFKRLYLNMWISSVLAWMDMTKWDNCNNRVQLSFLINKKAYVGVDLSTTTDLTSIGVEIELGNNTYAFLTHSFMPEGKLKERTLEDKVDYLDFVNKGLITLIPGDVIEYEYVYEKIEEWNLLFDIQEICYDPYNATDLINHLSKKDYKCVEIRQVMAVVTGPLKDIENKVYLGKVIHFGNPLLRHAMSYTKAIMDSNGNIKLDKAKSKKRIDPVITMQNSHVRCMKPEKINETLEDKIRTGRFGM